MKRPYIYAVVGLLLVLLLVPVVASVFEQPYLLTLFSRAMILGIAALGLNIILGFGGLVSFGHALYVGIGAYAVGILNAKGLHGGWLHFAVVILAATIVAIPIGAICLRTSGMAFIMITLAFGQMFYFLAIGVKSFGGDDGLSLQSRSHLPFSIENDLGFYLFVFAILVGLLFGCQQLIGSRFGTVIIGAKINASRMQVLGYPIFRYQLVAYVVSAVICAVAGALLSNLTRYVSPAYMQWTLSGDLIVMCVLGGMNSIVGPVFGAIAIIILEDLLAHLNIGLPFQLDEVIANHWLAVLGGFIVLVTLTMKQGLFGIVFVRERKS